MFFGIEHLIAGLEQQQIPIVRKAGGNLFPQSAVDLTLLLKGLRICCQPSCAGGIQQTVNTCVHAVVNHFLHTVQPKFVNVAFLVHVIDVGNLQTDHIKAAVTDLIDHSLGSQRVAPRHFDCRNAFRSGLAGNLLNIGNLGMDLQNISNQRFIQFHNGTATGATAHISRFFTQTVSHDNFALGSYVTQLIDTVMQNIRFAKREIPQFNADVVHERTLIDLHNAAVLTQLPGNLSSLGFRIKGKNLRPAVDLIDSMEIGHNAPTVDSCLGKGT